MATLLTLEPILESGWLDYSYGLGLGGMRTKRWRRSAGYRPKM